jgi:hypothetical protein
MKTTQALFFSGLVVAGLAGFALAQDQSAHNTHSEPAVAHKAEAATPARSVVTNTDYPVIGYLERRDRTITIKAGPAGPLYSIKTANGKVLCENLSQEQVTAQAPELGEFLKTAVAGTAGVKADARVRVIGDGRLR